MMKLQSLATVTGASSAGVTNEAFFFADAEFEAELPSLFVGVVVNLTAKTFPFLALLLLYLLPEPSIINFFLFYAIYL